MADCGSSGSVIDRTARSIFLAAATTANGTDSTNSATKQVVSSLLGHVTRGASSSIVSNNAITIGNPLLLNPPEELVLIQNQHQNVNKNIINNHTIYRQQQQQQQQQHPTQHTPYHPQQQSSGQSQYNMPTMTNHTQAQFYQKQQQQFLLQQQQQQQQQYQMMMMMQQQQQQQHLMMLHQQQQIIQAKAIRQQQQTQSKNINQQEIQTESSTVTENVQDESHVVGHEGIVQDVSIEELTNGWREATISDPALETSNQTGTVGHEGIVNDLTMNQLSAAWAEANDEYQAILEQHQLELQQQQQEQQEYDDEYYDNNLWTDDDTEELRPYAFIHKITDEVLNGSVLGNSTNEANNNDPINWMETGMEQFNAGNIKDAIRSFEMELQVNNNDNAIAWRMLGKCHAENDMDREAIICFEHSVDRDPYCTESLLALGVSYVNELDHTKALQSLKAWITHNHKFSTIDFDATEDVYGTATATVDNENSFDEVQRLLLKALEVVSSNDNEMDSSLTADVLEALGVVYNVSRDYDAAVQSFQKAVKIRPNDYQLWNKLGATLANSNQSSDALPSYHRALQIKPKYARAWLNMAISHSNLHNYNEAARCYLQTLSLNRSAVHCWSYLRIALSCAEQWDLIPAAAAQDIQAFVNHYDFIMYEP